MSKDNNIVDVNILTCERFDLFLSDYLDKNKLTLKDLCERIDVSYSHVSQIRRSKKNLPIHIAAVFHSSCKLNLNYLASGLGSFYTGDIEALESRLSKIEKKLKGKKLLTKK